MPSAIVTGASRGIGRGIALRLAADGFSVLLNDIGSQQSLLHKTVAEINDNGQQAAAFVGDVSSLTDVQNMIAEAVRRFGELNVMVANAGILETSSLLDMTVEKWDRTYAINTRGVFLCYAEAAKQMIKQGEGGKLIAACSISGYRPSGKAPAYCSSKWAVRGLTQTAALEFGEYNITVNAYCPGSVKTDMSTVFAERLAKDRGREAGDSGKPNVDDVYKNSSHRKNALNQELFPEDIAGLVSFLASKGSARMTGQTIICDGGMYFS
ncbi:hypothetical protein LTR10_020887 [Elasticomyces elasticus]|uniref:3-oxoacyl-[acyl-carrier-protein] reductase n=1 Tax=Exophiala sideris TaxID=1016849 RepID=A0ABR0IZN3_9EURO|nr:hypothetical protein LTR10_020887 [Elasticomyces elasticus]KAK5023400.1 hypothetical protein LTS07_009275 [Exophiala sideris]KAK5028224.1 hypothetical protein LTR13_009212 [Exophiala sideris]KAK5052882.1 hypothetical protein LTR69_009708 [Exophiala sideris]KAK5178493.1 hypothetical protein LTR44_009118 [Eurotiomycetes sp. CCFEE 6388]